MNVLVINCGSSSLKFDVLDVDERETLAAGQVERIGAVSSLASYRIGQEKKERRALQAADHTEALRFVMKTLFDGDEKLDVEIEAVGHRVVHGGEEFADAVLIDEFVLEAIRDAFDLAPLHNPANLLGIKAAQAALPDVPHVAVFDTAFHQTLPEHAYLYAIPNRLYRRHKIRRYGFHGTSHYYVSRQLYDLAGIDKRNSRVMGTRSGTIDPSIVFDLVEKEELTLAEVHTLLNKYSGLLGLSGYAADMRDLLAEADKGDRRCRQAVNVFCFRAKGYIGQYLAALNGADALVFTAGIGANSPRIRARICDELTNLGIRIDPQRNQAAVGTAARISTDDSAVQVWAIPTNEELVIAIDTQKIATARMQSPYV